MSKAHVVVKNGKSIIKKGCKQEESNGCPLSEAQTTIVMKGVRQEQVPFSLEGRFVFKALRQTMEDPVITQLVNTIIGLP